MNKNLFLSLICLMVLTGPALAQETAHQAAAWQKFHEFDFWIGEWDVDGTVRQVWEQRKDKGENWQVVFDGTHKRKNP